MWGRRRREDDEDPFRALRETTPGSSFSSSPTAPATGGHDARATPIARRTPAKKRTSGTPAAVALVAPSGFRRALATLRGTLRRGEVVTTMRLDRSRLIAISHNGAGDQRVLTISPRLAVSATSGGHDPGPALMLSAIDPPGPLRATRAAAAHGRFSTRRLDYLAITASIIRGRPSQWSLFFSGVPARDRFWQADLSGGHTHRPGES
ncbi:MAG: hypothetical protein JWQ48_244 [Conexibacter sp.]|nr:hypothetical protein [Conexibacter sp.]